MSDSNDSEPGFDALGLPAELLATLRDLGYEAPSPIQAATIPALLAGHDVLGQAQTGTGKTAAFALPILARLKPGEARPAALVLAPTRELAIQVAEAFQTYASGLRGFHVLPIYGGQAYAPQLNGLKRGPDVVVGTPGRIIDHLGKGTLKIDQLQTLVLDEADEMLRMGFIDDVRDVMERIPETCQKALFSATMPDAIRRIAERHMSEAEHVTIRSKTTTAANTRQRYWVVSGMHKLDALTRILEVEEFDGMIVFARTRIATEQLAQRLEARGFSAAALNGDVPQKQREQIVDRLKRGEIDILTATDVAARGLDVERISHVINYDIPHDTEAYVHRIGRTGRAGRSGEAILFVAPRERGMLRAIERATRQPIESMTLPTVGDVNAQRLVRFQARIKAALESDELDAGRETVQQTLDALDTSIEDLAAALALIARGQSRSLGDDSVLPTAADQSPEAGRGPRDQRGQGAPSRRDAKSDSARDADLASYRIEVGASHGVKPGNIVGAIANEAGLDAGQIGRINIQQDFSTVDLPANLAAETLEHLRGVRVASQPLLIRLDTGTSGQSTSRPGGPSRSASSPGRPSDKKKPRDESEKDKTKKPHEPDKPRLKRPARTRAERKAGFKSRKKT
ncbi:MULTISPECIES: DEAD/DEAH box helicase [unclassified Wenzhouxiangella]|uniref:DEAD/DEAH box helicase n=1 Tax=unclassified Wenzhouxiangella TaxID=2613841 RepID=UPI000E32639C|nr:MULTISPECIES: DEAD/DEAH box helicase [unclassified Wenzhouxiangella]RFF27254.1 ATP-dependent RNA helicase [Wenzhouxiangella sp. 15181]RFP69288.1 ATP-dependent RNA helicase [Wenzhouxiangella sp. 15190]